MKFALVSHGLPPGVTVQSIIIYRLLKALDPKDYCLITQEPPSANRNSSSVKTLPARYYHLSPWLNWKRGTGFELIRWWNVWSRALQIARIAKREQCEAVVGFTSELFDLPASYFASRRVGIKFYAYLLDYYSPTAAGSKAERFTARLEPTMLLGATGITVPNEFLRDELRSRYGVESSIIHNPCDLSQYENAPPYAGAIEQGQEIRIVYTGSIYEAHHSAFRNLLTAIQMLNRPKLQLHVYSNQPASRLADAQLSGRVVFEQPVPVERVPEIQWQADLLFFPLSFTSPYPEIIKTSSPGKMGEYLAAGRPILIHAPADSYLTWYFRKYDCGIVVSENDPAALADAIDRLLTDTNLRLRLVANAKERARIDFSMSASQKAFASLMEVPL